ncbi:2-hydroxypenta-2,4-dienoate hydratase [Streptomyces sp. CBMA156]|nr:2-hydroxypenta-2,4-dienoate hydratase [Streptomyces sp. CBMA156]MBD0675798.1 2-hydroxypenta-2,4-dienoate hydratase [Streptomyces sp. CBMA156]
MGNAQGWVEDEAGLLREAERSRRPVAPLTKRHPMADLGDAYRIQWAGVQQRLGGGARVVGHKVGLTSAAMREQMGIDEPDFGVLLDDMVVPIRGELALDGLISPRIEAEFAFRLCRDLAGESVGVREARAAVGEVLLALEVIDTRYQDWNLALVDSIADNAACARIVAGPAVPFLPDLNLPSEVLTVTVDGTAVASGAGSEILDDPIESVAWLARRLAAFGLGLKAGEVVLAGAVHASLPLTPGQVSVSSAHLPPVSVQVR